MPFFGGISQETLEFLSHHTHPIDLQPNEYFCHEGDDATSMFVLETGKVNVSKLYQGEEHILKQLHQGDCFGEMALIDLHPRSASVMAIEPCHAIEISNANMLQLYQHNLEQFTIIQMNIAREISRRLRLSDEQLFKPQ